MISQIINEQFEIVYEQTNRKVKMYLISKCKNFSDINDVMQEVYMEYYRVLQRKGMHYIKNDESFLINLCKKKLASYYSFWDRIPHKVYIDDEDISDAELLMIENELVSFEEIIIREETIEQIKKMLQSKDDIIKKIFYMYYSMDMHLSEIGKQLNMNVQTVKSKLYRTRKEIYEQLSEM